MQIRKPLVIAGSVAVLGLASVAGAASAQTNGNSLVDDIANKFHLDKSQVQQVFDQHKSDRQANAEQRYEDRLTQAVKDGKLTEDQKTKLIAKHKDILAQLEKDRADLKSQRQSIQSMTDAQRQALRDQRKTELDKLKADIQQWEKDNNIPSGYLGIPGPGMGGMGHGHMMGDGDGPGV